MRKDMMTLWTMCSRWLVGWTQCEIMITFRQKRLSIMDWQDAPSKRDGTIHDPGTYPVDLEKASGEDEALIVGRWTQI